MKARALIPLLLLALLGPLPAGADAHVVDHEGVHAEVGSAKATLSNGIVTREWAADALETVSVGRDGSEFSTSQPDFVLYLDGAGIASSFLTVQSVVPSEIPGGAALTWTLGGPDGVQIVRRVEAYAGIAGFKSQTTIASTVPVALSAYTLDEVAVGSASRSVIQSFRAGADWRDPSWDPPSIGDSHAGDFRESRPDAPQAGDASLTGQGQWLSVVAGGRNVGVVSERRDYASSVVTYTGGPTGIARAEVDLSRDIVYIGPFEESGHVENPGPGPARHRVFGPAPVALEPAFTIFAADSDDEAWQFYKYLTRHRNGSYKKRVMFNSDKVDINEISTGAKDDMNYDRFVRIIDEVKEMGADTFIFDDGWMARSGDWCPDSEPPAPAECQEPRWDGVQGSKFRPRFPDRTFEAVREQLGNLELGLWMNPMEFHPSSKAFRTNPQWACMPVGDALAVYNIAEPNSSSNEAGLGVWNPLALGVHPDTGEPMLMIDYMQERIERAIYEWGARYFKFDFLVWVDCGGAFPVTMYEYHDAFVDMLDEIQAGLPEGTEVTFQIDETNDYRMFPFESTSRGPAWFLNNGGSNNAEILHAVWNLSPYIPGYSLGMRSLGAASPTLPMSAIDAALASSLLGHLTFSFPVDDRLTTEQRAQVKKWTDFYHANSDTLAGMTYPLLEDPANNRWTALQSWNGDTKSGWLLAYRQGEPALTSKDVSLRGLGGVADDALFHVVRIDPASGDTDDLGNVTALTLKTGFNVQIAQPNGYAIYRITRV